MPELRMSGDIGFEELSPELQAIIENGIGNGSIGGTFNGNVALKTEVLSVIATEERQKQFTIPKANYINGTHNFELRLGSVWIHPDRYQVVGKKVIFNEDEKGVAQGRRLDFVFCYIITDNSEEMPINGERLVDGTITEEKLTDELRAKIESTENIDNIKNNINGLESKVNIVKGDVETIKTKLDSSVKDIEPSNNFNSIHVVKNDGTTEEIVIKVLGGGSGSSLNVFKTGERGGSFTATEEINSFVVDELNDRTDISVIFKNLFLVRDVDYTVDIETKTVVLSFNLKVDQTVYYILTDTSFNYDDLNGAPKSLPANGGNADTVGGKSADDFFNRKGVILTGEEDVLKLPIGHYQIEGAIPVGKNYPPDLETDDSGYRHLTIMVTGACAPNSIDGYRVIDVVDSYGVGTYRNIQNWGSWTGWKRIALTEDVSKKLNGLVWLADNTDPDTVIETGLYKCTTWTTVPNGNIDRQGIIVCVNYGGNTTMSWTEQTFYCPHVDKRWTRNRANTRWTEWQEIPRWENLEAVKNQKYVPSDGNATQRNTDTIPRQYVTGLYTNQLKSATPLGLPASAGYIHLIGVNMWTDHTGGVSELGLSSGGGMYLRNSASDETWHDWQQVHTSKKYPFYCTASAGWTIVESNCYEQNGKVHIELMVKLSTNGYTMSQNYQYELFAVPTAYRPSVPKPMNVMALRDNGALLTESVNNGAVWSNGNGYTILHNSTNTTHLRIACDYEV